MRKQFIKTSYIDFYKSNRIYNTQQKIPAAAAAAAQPLEKT